MSNRTPSSVRTGASKGDDAPPSGAVPAEPAPASATQSIPTTTGGMAAQPGPARESRASEPVAAGGAATGDTAPTDAAAAPAGGPPTAGGSATGQSGRPRKPGKVGGRGPRRARLQLRHIDTWSALKISFVLSIALFFIWMVAVGVLYGVLSALGVFDTLNDLFGQLGTASGTGGGGDVVTIGLVFGGAAVIGAINIVLMTALCTVGAFIYNLCSDLVGGLEVTLSERD